MDKNFVSRFLKGSVSASTGTIATVVFHFLSITIMTRSVEQKTLGLYFLILATAMFFKIISNLGMDLTLVKFLSDENNDTSQTISSIIWSRLLIVSLFGFVVYLGGDFILPLLGEGMEPFVLYIPYIFIGHSIRELFLHLMQGLQQFKNYALVQVISAILKFSLVFIFLRQLNLETLLYIEMAMLGSSIFLQLWMIPFRKLGMAWQNFNRTTLRQVFTFGMPLYYTSILTIGYSKSSVFLINYFLDPLSIALYEVALKIPEGVTRIFRSFITVYFPSISTLFSQGKKREAVKVMNKSISYFSLLCTLMCVGAFLFSREIVTFLFSEQYSNVGFAFAMLMVGVYLRVTANTLGYSLVSAGYPTTSSKVNTISVIVFLTSSVLLIPRVGYLGAVFATIIMNSSAILCYYLYLLRADLAPSPMGFVRPTVVGVGVLTVYLLLPEPHFLVKVLYFLGAVGLTAVFVPDFRESVGYLMQFGKKLSNRSSHSSKKSLETSGKKV